jgi:cobalamin-dependent methionine synthase I
MRLKISHDARMERLAGQLELTAVGESHLFASETHFPLPDIVRLLGSSNSTAPSNRILKKVEFWKDQLRLTIQPRLVYSVWPAVKRGRSRIEITNGIQFKSKKLADALSHSRFVVFFAATLGENIEAEINKLSRRNQFSDAYIVDAIGSVGVEQIVEQFNRQLDSNLRYVGNGVTLPFSPGYCDWPLEEQSKLFSLVDAHRIGVGLSDSFLMIPRKSISGVFGLTEFPSSFTQHMNPCLECGKVDCAARRTPQISKTISKVKNSIRGL